MSDNNQKKSNPANDQQDQDQDINLDDLQKQIKKLEDKDKQEESKKVEKGKEQDEKEQKIEELTQALARAMADLQNYKRRAEEDKMRFVKFANTELLLALIPIIDNFDRSTEHLPDDLKKNDWTKGVVQIHDNFLKTLEKIGVKKMKTVGQNLDPNLHEALMSGSGKKDVIIEEFEPGYLYNDEALKAAKVKVGDGSK